MSWKIEVVVDDSGEWEGDPLRFETQREALAYARDLEFRWSAVRDNRVVKSEDPVNHSWPQCGPWAESTSADGSEGPARRHPGKYHPAVARPAVRRNGAETSIGKQVLQGIAS